MSNPELPISLVDREYVSQYSVPTFGIVIHKSGVVDDPDGNNVEVTMTDDNTGDVVFTRSADRADLGTFEIQPSSVETQTPSFYTLQWDYSLDAIVQVYRTQLEVGPTAPMYDNLDPSFKLIVEQTWNRFADLYDSPMGGPHLQVYLQTHFGRNRVAELINLAVGSLNTIAQPHTTYGLDPNNNPFPVGAWGPLLEQMLYLEVIRHLRRSYTEQPVLNGTGGVATFDRRDYWDRWGQILAEEEARAKPMLDSFKIANMGLGAPFALVSGGVYGSYGPSRLPGSAAARPRYYYAYN
jgi:hypothetical protein